MKWLISIFYFFWGLFHAISLFQRLYHRTLFEMRLDFSDFACFDASDLFEAKYFVNAKWFQNFCIDLNLPGTMQGYIRHSSFKLFPVTFTVEWIFCLWTKLVGWVSWERFERNQALDLGRVIFTCYYESSHAICKKCFTLALLLNFLGLITEIKRLTHKHNSSLNRQWLHRWYSYHYLHLLRLIFSCL